MLFSILLSLGLALAEPLTVIVDPGHGGRDDGAVRAGHNEAAITLQVGKLLHNLLKKDRRFQSHLTRTANDFVSLPERSRIAGRNGAEVFVSIHVNSNPDARVQGAEFYFQNQLASDEESMLLAHRENSEGETTGKAPYPYLERNRYPAEVKAIVNDLLDSDRILRSSQLSKALKQSWRGSKKSKNGHVRQAPFFVLSQMAIPSSLVELGFLTNPDELQELTNPSHQKRMAEDLYRGLVAYKESMDKNAAAP